MSKKQKQRLFAVGKYGVVSVGLLALSAWMVLQFLVEATPVVERTALVAEVNTEEVRQQAQIQRTEQFQSYIQDLVTRYAAAQAPATGIYIEHLETGVSASHNADKVFVSASLYKAFVANEVYKLADQGRVGLSSTIQTETGPNRIDTCLDVMITVSDNSCGRALVLLVLKHVPVQQLKDQGFYNTNLSGLYPETTAHDVAQLFKNLSHGSYLSSQSKEALMSLFKNQQINDRLPQQLPDDVVVAHKTGDIDGFVHDGGIVFALNGAYIIVILSGPWQSTPAAYSSIAMFSRQVYDLVQSY